MPDRTIAPRVHTITNLHLRPPVLHHLDNGIPVYVTNMGTQEIVKMEIVFHAGRPYEHKRLVSRATAHLLKEGTHHYTAQQIAEKIDFYGGTFYSPVNLDTSNFVLYSLTRHFDKLLPVIADILQNPLFAQKELDNFIDRNLQRLSIDLVRPDVISYRTITEKLFTPQHPYGYNSEADTYRALTRADLIKHFEENYRSGNCQIFLSGNIPPAIITMLNQELGNNIPAGKKQSNPFSAPTSLPEKLYLPQNNSMQTAIRIGRRLFNRKHPDYHAFQILNTILGGYFGSRLMTNIREEKGYTYNISSVVDAMLFDGYFYIGTEVGTDFREQAIAEIFHEMQKLQTEPVPPEELLMVKNYLSGTFLTMLDGAFNVSDIIKTLTVAELGIEHFNELVKTVQDIDAEKIQYLAQKYFSRHDMWEIAVG